MDTEGPERILPFWCDVMGVKVRSTWDDGRYLMLDPNREGLMVVLHRVPQPKGGKNRAHFDMLVDDLDEATALVESSEVVGRTRSTPLNLTATPGAPRRIQRVSVQ
jgi:hypothetical protein